MTATEHVMAVICRPLSGRELLQTEKDSNVIIHRRIEYEGGSDMFSLKRFLERMNNLPLKIMFIFGIGDSVIINRPEDTQEVYRRLLAL